MATCVFVEQGVVKQNARVVDRGIIRDKRDFAEIGRAFVHRDHLFEYVLVLFGTDVHRLTVFEFYPEVFDKFALIRQGFC